MMTVNSAIAGCTILNAIVLGFATHGQRVGQLEKSSESAEWQEKSDLGVK